MEEGRGGGGEEGKGRGKASRSRKSRRVCETTPGRPTDTPRRHSTSTLDQPTNQPSKQHQPTSRRTTISTPTTTYDVVAPRCPPDAVDARSASMKMTSRQKAPAFNYQSYASRSTRARARAHACPCVHPCVHARVRAAVRACVRACRQRRRPSTRNCRASGSSWNWHVTRATERRRDTPRCDRAFRVERGRALGGNIDRDLE